MHAVLLFHHDKYVIDSLSILLSSLLSLDKNEMNLVLSGLAWEISKAPATVPFINRPNANLATSTSMAVLFLKKKEKNTHTHTSMAVWWIVDSSTKKYSVYLLRRPEFLSFKSKLFAI